MWPKQVALFTFARHGLGSVEALCLLVLLMLISVKRFLSLSGCELRWHSWTHPAPSRRHSSRRVGLLPFTSRASSHPALLSAMRVMISMIVLVTASGFKVDVFQTLHDPL